MTISEASSRIGITCDTLRYYEKIGLVEPVARLNGGRRSYSESDCVFQFPSVVGTGLFYRQRQKYETECHWSGHGCID
ncbi:MerR family DNA-binding transcriptional regulator [Clostridium transplantifaecale]|uniref:MerR family DNA-binding transcriptional regulator n=1 Tax=Clostridium transplantifaecale TaxID=2479838 RepID=UPI000F63103E|nr:MerR family DNA-binding transcriptional regulator [Clostridium transplantifaecale]